MIDYSVSARPNPIKKDEDPLFYASPQVSEIISLDKFCRHISEHNSKYNRADIMAVLTQSVDCLREMLLDGKKVLLGDLGSFTIGLNSRGAITSDSFNPNVHIKRVHVNWSPGEAFSELIKMVEWNLVANRRAQQLLLKAVKNGDTTVDISKPDEEGAGDEVGAED